MEVLGVFSAPNRGKGWEEKMKPGGHSKNSEVKWLERVKGAGRMAASVG